MGPSKPPAPQKKRGGALLKVHFAYKQREYFSENLALLLKAGVPVDKALASLSAAATSAPLKRALNEMRADVDAGANLADALERSGLISGQSLALVRLGESSGHLVENLQVAAQQEEKHHIFTSKVRSALIYPSFVLSLTFIIGLAVAWFLLPRLAETFARLNVTLPAISKLLINAGLFLKAHGKVVVPLLLLGIGIILYILFAAPKTKHIGQRMLFAAPGIGRLMSEVEIAQFGYLLGTLLDAGLPVTKTLELMAGATSSRRHQRLYKYIGQSLADGFSFQDSLKRYKGSEKLIPSAVQQMIIAGESSGSLPEVLKTIGRTYEEKADITTNNLESIIEPVLLVLVAGGVMLVAVAVILPIYSLVGGLNK